MNATLLAIIASNLWDVSPGAEGDPTLLVLTPGLERAAYHRVIRRMKRGRDLRVFELGCEDVDRAGAVRALVEEARALPDGYTVVAHGLGATLALSAATELEASRYLLMAPVLDLEPVAALEELAALRLPSEGTIDVSGDRLFGERSLVEVLLGGVPTPRSCVPASLAGEIQQWITDGVPLELEAVTEPVWIGVSLGDSVAAVEAVVPASRRLKSRQIERFGRNRFALHDYRHGELLWRRGPLRVWTRELRHPSRGH